MEELKSYETIDDIDSKLELLVAELSKTITMLEEEKIDLEELMNKNDIENIIEDYNGNYLERKPIIRTRKK